MTQDLVVVASRIARGSRVGFGAITPDDILAVLKLASNPIVAGKIAWAQIQGRSWDDAVASARARAKSGSWTKDDTASVQDLVVLIMSSAFNARDTKDVGSANALNQTWLAYLKRMGIDPTGMTVPDVLQKAKNNNASANILIPIAILGLIVQVLVVGAVYAIAIYYAASIVNNYLAISECDKQLARLQSQMDEITERHIQDGKPLTPDEKELQNKLLEQQKLVAGGCTKPAPLPTPPGFRQLEPGKGDKPQEPFDPWPYVIGGTILTVGALGIYYRGPIVDWIERRRVRRAHG